jgi:hypothetical protein
MKNQILGAAVLALAAACGGGSKPTLIDAPIDAIPTCSPIAQSGCKTGEKCTWIVDADANPTATPPTEEIGHIGCVAVDASAVIDGGTCMNAKAGVTGGADTCIAGDLCISSKCKPICDPQLVEGSGAAGACAQNYACSIYSGVFVSGSNATAGVCEPTCDPLTQKLNVGTTNIEACGSTDPTKPSGTCVIGAGFRSFHCAPTGPSLYGNTDRKPPLADSRGNYFGNGCAPGFVPFFFEDASGAMKTLCTGLCAPLKVDKMIAAMGGHAADNQGDVTVLAKLPTEATPKAGNAVCVPTKKGSSDVTSPLGEDCRFVWFPLSGGDPTMALQTQFNDTLGFCFAYEKFHDVRVTMNGVTTMQPEKSCADLDVTVPADDPYRSAKENGCYPLAQSRRAGERFTPRGALATFRLGGDSAPAVRHIFD